MMMICRGHKAVVLRGYSDMGTRRIWLRKAMEDGWVHGRVCNMIMMIRSTRRWDPASCILYGGRGLGDFEGRHQGVIWCILAHGGAF